MQGDILQMGGNPSKDGNAAASMYMRSETDLDCIAQAVDGRTDIFPKPVPESGLVFPEPGIWCGGGEIASPFKGRCPEGAERFTVFNLSVSFADSSP